MNDELWALVEPLLPGWPHGRPGHNPIPDRLCLQGVLFVLYTGIGWEHLPQELGFGSGMTCWRRLDREFSTYALPSTRREFHVFTDPSMISRMRYLPAWQHSLLRTPGTIGRSPIVLLRVPRQPA